MLRGWMFLGSGLPTSLGTFPGRCASVDFVITSYDLVFFLEPILTRLFGPWWFSCSVSKFISSSVVSGFDLKLSLICFQTSLLGTFSVRLSLSSRILRTRREAPLPRILAKTPQKHTCTHCMWAFQDSPSIHRTDDLHLRTSHCGFLSIFDRRVYVKTR